MVVVVGNSYELEFSLHRLLRAPSALFYRSAVNSPLPRQHCPLYLSVVERNVHPLGQQVATQPFVTAEY